MKDQFRTKQELLQEVTLLKQRIHELEKHESERKRIEEALRAYSADSATRFRRNPPPRSDPSRQGVPIDSATPGRSAATLVI